jgi:hypothetical protein
MAMLIGKLTNARGYFRTRRKTTISTALICKAVEQRLEVLAEEVATDRRKSSEVFHSVASSKEQVHEKRSTSHPPENWQKS